MCLGLASKVKMGPKPTRKRFMKIFFRASLVLIWWKVFRCARIAVNWSNVTVCSQNTKVFRHLRPTSSSVTKMTESNRILFKTCRYSKAFKSELSYRIVSDLISFLFYLILSYLILSYLILSYLMMRACKARALGEGGIMNSSPVHGWWVW